ncbi:MAG: cytochrome P450 [Litorimonas sp.]
MTAMNWLVNAAARVVPIERQIRTTHRIYKLHKAILGDPDAISFDPDPPGNVSNLPIETLDVSNPFLFKQGKWQAYFKRLRDEAPVHYQPDSPFGPFWSVTRYEDVAFVDRHHDLFSAEPAILLGDTPFGLPADTFIARDGEVHKKRRMGVQPVVAPKNLKEFEGLIRSRTVEVLEGLPVDVPFNWVERVSVELTARMLATILDFPYDRRHDLIWWSDRAAAHNAMTGGGADPDEFYEAAAGIVENFTALWREKEARLARGEEMGFDAISLMLQNEGTRDLVKTPMQFLGDLALLIVGGNDTTRNSMTGGILALNHFPDQMVKLRANPDLISNMISEIIRWQTPLAYMRRVAKRDVELGGQIIRKGDKVLMWYVSANRDERMFDDPDSLIIDRPNARNHLSFGTGVHRCMGNRLAELQLRILWEELLARFDRIEVVGAPEGVQSNFVKGYARLMVQLTPAAAPHG